MIVDVNSEGEIKINKENKSDERLLFDNSNFIIKDHIETTNIISIEEAAKSHYQTEVENKISSNQDSTFRNENPYDQNKSIISSDSNYADLNKRVKFNKQMDLNSFFKKSRHFFIMTDGGKPVYSRYGDELENCGILATFSAILAKFTSFNSTSGTEKVHYIITEKTTTVFLKKGKLILIALSKKKDTISYLNSNLEYLYIQLLSIISSDRISRLENNPSYCMSALSDTDEIFEGMVAYSSHTLISLLNSFHCLVIDSNARNKLYNICNENSGDALLSILLTPYEIIMICKNEAIPNVVSSDIILIQNLIFSSESLKHTESLVPICLPGISDSGYLQLYCKFLESNIGLVFITESQDLSIFLKFADQTQKIHEAMQKENLLTFIKSAVEHKNKSISFSIREMTNEYNRRNTISLTSSSPNLYSQDLGEDKIIEDFFMRLSNRSDSSLSYSTSSIFGNSNTDPFASAKYIVCKHKIYNQIFTFRFNDFDKITIQEKQVIKSYCKLFDIYNSQNLFINNQNFFHYEKSEENTHIIQANDSCILFTTFNFFKDFNEINTLTLEILKIIKYKESYFFINKY